MAHKVFENALKRKSAGQFECSGRSTIVALL